MATTTTPSAPITQPLHIDHSHHMQPFVSLHNHATNTGTTAVIPANEIVKNRIVIATKLLGDVLVAVSVTAMAAPFLAVIDKALVERTTAAASSSSTTTNRMTVWTSIYHSSVAIVQQPMKFFRSPTFLWMWGTYAATYTAANTLRTLLVLEKAPVASSKIVTPTAAATRNSNNTIRTNSYSNYFLSSGTTLLIGTSIVNSTASVLKDRAYAQLYGATAKATANNNSTLTKKLMVPNITYGLWVLRDLTVIGAAFVLPNHVAQFWIQQQSNSSNNNNNNSKTTSSNYYPRLSDATIIRLSQVGTPVLAQVIAGPLHFIGYDCYNHHNAPAPLQNHISSQFRGAGGHIITPVPPLSISSYQFWSERMNNLRSSIGQVVVARMMRIIPGYGIAGICNTELLLQWKNHMVQPILENDAFWDRNHDKCRTDVNTAVWNPHHQQRC